MIRRRLLCFGLATGVAVLSGCQGAKKKAPAGPSVRELRVGVALANVRDDYTRAMQSVLEEMSERRGFDLALKQAGGKADRQVEQIEELIEEKVNVLLVQPTNPARIVGALKKATAAGILVGAMDETVPGASIATLVEFNHELSGELAADFLRVKLPKGGLVGVIAGRSTPEQSRRLKAFSQYLAAKAPGCKVARTESVDSEGNLTASAERLLGGGKLAAVVAMTDDLALEVVRAIRAGKGDPATLVIGYGGTPEAIEELKTTGSPLAMTVSVQPQRLARVALRNLMDFHTNKNKVEHRRIHPFPVTTNNYGSWPGYDGELPRDAKLDWPSELKLGARNLQSGAAGGE